MIAPLITAFFGLVFLCVPIAFTIGLVAYIGVFSLGVPAIIVPQKLFGGLDSFVMLAVPLFILAAEVMNRTGITEDLVSLSNVFVGRLPGGLGYSNILTSTFFGGISGSAVADAASLGKIFVPAMERQGDSRPYAAAVTAASAIQSPLIPPSIIGIIYASVMGVSVGALFLGTLVPGLLIGLSVAIVHFLATRRRGKAAPLPQGTPHSRASALRGLLALPMPLIILGGIVFGVFTATEAAAVAVVYALILGASLRKLRAKDIYPMLSTTANVSSQVLLIISAAAILGWLMSMMQLPSMLADLLLSASVQPFMILLIINAALLLIGMFLEPASAIVLFGPVLLPVSRALGLDPVHFGALMLANLTLGMVTPPVGTVLYATCAAARVSVDKLSRALVPFLISALAILLLVTFVPAVALTLPRLFGLM